MAILEPRSVSCEVQLTDASADYKNAVRVAQFRVSETAFYMPAFPGTQYIPFSCLTAAVLRKASLSTIGCCGKELPVLKLILRWNEGEKELVIDPPKHADKILEQIRAARPDLDIDDRRA
mgnify:CR=1 FL=1